MHADMSYAGYTVYFDGHRYLAEPSTEYDAFLQMGSQNIVTVIAAIDDLHACEYDLPDWLSEVWGFNSDAFVDLDKTFVSAQAKNALALSAARRR